MAHLEHRVAFFLWHGLAPSTRRAYATARMSYERHVRVRLLSAGPIYPAPPRFLASWAVTLAPRLSVSSIKRYLSGLRSWHVDLGLAVDQFSDRTLERCLCGIRRFYGEKDRRPCLPITLPVLERCLATLAGRLVVEGHALTIRELAVLRAAWTLAFASFLRCGEATYDRLDPAFNISRQDVSVSSGSVTLHVPASKTDYFCRGVTITMPKTGVIACVHAAVSSLLTLTAAEDAEPLAPLFHRGQILGSRRAPFTRTFFIVALRVALTRAGVTQPQAYAGHSFRRGDTTWASWCGLSDSQIQTLGRWNSDCFRRYIDTPPAVVLDCLRHLYEHTSSARVRFAVPQPDEEWQADVM